MAVTSMSRNSIGNGQERYNRASGKDNNLEWCGISTTPTGSYSDSEGNWDYWIFKSSGSITVSKPGLIDYVVVAGGGGGAATSVPSYSGAGGAGGVRQPEPGETIQAGTYAVTVGAGAPAVGGSGNGSYGNASSIGSDIVAVRGGAAGNRYVPGGGGGSGGGCGQGSAGNAPPPDNQAGGFGTLGQGFRGGNPGTNASAGGGAGAAGNDGQGPGGIGRIVTIIPSAVATAQSVGEVNSGNVYFGGGGGAGSASQPGGLGGGGDASPGGNSPGTNGDPNTGGGGGGGEGIKTGGGSGVVIVRTRV